MSSYNEDAAAPRPSPGIGPLGLMARRTRSEPFFLGFDLYAYQAVEGIDDAELARRLGCPVGILTLIRLCRALRGVDDVRQVAGHFGCDAVALARVVGIES